MSTATADRSSFDSMLADALSTDNDQYSSHLDRMINGAGVVEQEKINSKNLSAIIGNIRDHGPASKGEASTNTSHDTKTDHHVSEHDKEELLSRIHDDVLHTVSTDTGGRMVWQIATLLLLVTMLGMITMFQFKTDDSLMQINTGLEQATDEYIKQLVALQETSVPVAKYAGTGTDQNVLDLEAAITQLNEEMQMLNGRLDEFDIQQSKSSELMAVLQNQIAPRLKKLAATEEAIAEAASSIVITNRKLGLPEAAQPAIKTEEDESLESSWMVNLGTFSDRNKADKANRSLIEQGVASRVHVSTVNDRTVYRLSVGGFDTRDAAASFRANKAIPLGYKQSWLRKG